MTKVIILGETPKEKEKKPIEFVLSCNNIEGFTSTSVIPKEFDSIELICKSFCPSQNTPYAEYDLMFAYNGDYRHMGLLFLGHFNDGVV